MTERARKLFEKVLATVIEAEKVSNMEFEEYNKYMIEHYGREADKKAVYAQIVGTLSSKLRYLRYYLEDIKEEVE